MGKIAPGSGLSCMWITDTLPPTAFRWGADSPVSEQQTSDRARSLDHFLASVEKRAFRIARIAVRNDDDALDIVQDAMLQLARRYGQRPNDEWRPLFYRILQNRIRDCQRRRAVRAKLFAWLPGRIDAEDAADLHDSAADAAPLPADQLMAEEAIRTLELALAALPGRQQQAFLLRTFEGMDVAATAAAMGCSEGSVKTHYSRAVHTLRAQLGEAW
jgi:RNA polymerase sigma-70 factor (ECF subfamily)